MRSLNLDQLQTLVAIADLGTFAAAHAPCTWARPWRASRSCHLAIAHRPPALDEATRNVLALLAEFAQA